MGQGWKGNQRDLAHKGALPAAATSYLKKGFKRKGPLSYHLRQNQDIPKMYIPNQKLFSAYAKCIQSMSLLFIHFPLV
jgi:hypothetical protein